MKYAFAVFAIYNAAFIILILVYWLLTGNTKNIPEPYLTNLWINFAAYCILDKLDNLKIKQ